MLSVFLDDVLTRVQQPRTESASRALTNKTGLVVAAKPNTMLMVSENTQGKGSLYVVNYHNWIK